MGNCSMKGTTGECHHSIRVMCDSGAFLQLKAPKTVAQVLQHYPGYGIFRQGHASAPLPEQQKDDVVPMLRNRISESKSPPLPSFSLQPYRSSIDMLNKVLTRMIQVEHQKSCCDKVQQVVQRSEEMCKSSACHYVENLSNGSALEVLPTAKNGVWRVKAGLKFAFTHFNTENEDGIKSKPYIFLLGLLMSQYTLIGYDASAPYEETNGADRNGPTRIISAVGISITVGWGYIIYIIFAITSIPYILSESNDAGGYAIAEMFYQAFKTRYGNGIGGLGRGIKWAGIRKLNLKHKVDLVCIQETKNENFTKIICQTIWGDSNVSWDSVPSVRKKATWEEFRQLRASNPEGLWCFLGDFNSIRSQEERIGSSQRIVGTYDTSGFNEWISDMELQEIKSFGSRFTWFRPNGSVKSRLDRCLWLSNWPDSSQHVIQRDFSDQCPIILKTNMVDWGAKPFRTFPRVSNTNSMKERWEQQICTAIPSIWL
ncbi:Amino-acid permease BAT1 [Glycine max]|nr:Amino-acid permease BAT1 [Glycine max]